MNIDYFFLAVFLAIAVAFPLLPLAIAWAWGFLFSPAKPGADKKSTYECGIASSDSAPIRFQSHYYLYAIIFLIFDVEAVFLVPFATAYLGLSTAAIVTMLVFLLLLVEGLAWAWAKGALAWK